MKQFSFKAGKDALTDDHTNKSACHQLQNIHMIPSFGCRIITVPRISLGA